MRLYRDQGVVLRTIRDKMTRIAAHAMEMSPDDVECVDGTFRAKGAPGTSMTMGEVAMRAHLFAHDNPVGESSGLVDTHTYDHPYATPPNADRRNSLSKPPWTWSRVRRGV